jgi:amidophosphoribosyltransferase
MYINYPCGLALAHNGNLTNADRQRVVLGNELRHLNTSSDSEVLLNVFGEELRKALISMSPRVGGRDLVKNVTPKMVFTAVEATMKRISGGYAVVVLIHNVGIVGFRDPHGIRPMCFGKRDSTTMPGGIDYVIASESAALDGLGYKLVNDVAPGEALLMLPMIEGQPRENLGLCRQRCHASPSLNPCIIEYIYFARADSTIDGVSVYEARLRMGERLAHRIRQEFGEDFGIDVVVPVPESARAAALQCAYALDRPYREGFIVNRYIGRTFIMPGQKVRRKGVRMKLNTIKAEFKDKRVLLVDDSIVRGTTSIELVQMAREAGAKEVYLVSAAPQVRYPNFYGIDIPTCTELIAHKRETEEIAKKIGVKWLLYQELGDLEAAVRSLNDKMEIFESSVFSGKYIAADVDPTKVASLQKEVIGSCYGKEDPQLGDDFQLDPPDAKRQKMLESPCSS